MGGKSGGGGGDHRNLQGQGRVQYVDEATSRGYRHFDPTTESWPEYVDYTQSGPPGGNKPPPAAPPVPTFEPPDYSDLFADIERQREQQRQEQLRREAMREIDTLLSARTEAEQAAIKTIDSDITRNLDRARLLGLDFSVPDEERMSRISTTFGELFPEEQDSRLVQLMSKYGSPDMSTAERQAIEAGDIRFVPEFAISRMEAAEGVSGASAEGVAAGGSAMNRPGSGRRRGLLDEEDNPIVLGG